MTWTVILGSKPFHVLTDLGCGRVMSCQKTGASAVPLAPPSESFRRGLGTVRIQVQQDSNQNSPALQAEIFIQWLNSHLLSGGAFPPRFLNNLYTSAMALSFSY